MKVEGTLPSYVHRPHPVHCHEIRTSIRICMSIVGGSNQKDFTSRTRIEVAIYEVDGRLARYLAGMALDLGDAAGVFQYAGIVLYGETRSTGRAGVWWPTIGGCIRSGGGLACDRPQSSQRCCRSHGQSDSLSRHSILLRDAAWRSSNWWGGWSLSELCLRSRLSSAR